MRKWLTKLFLSSTKQKGFSHIQTSKVNALASHHIINARNQRGNNPNFIIGLPPKHSIYETYYLIICIKCDEEWAQTYVNLLEFRMPIDLQPPFSSMTIAHSVYFFETALWSTDSPSSSTAFGSAPANNSSCHCSGCKRASGRKYINNKC